MSKVIRDCIGFVCLRPVIGLKKKNSRHSFNQSDANKKPVTTCSPALSRTLGGMLGFSMSSHWFFRIFSSLLSGCCDNCGLVFTTLDRKGLYLTNRERKITRRKFKSVWLRSTTDKRSF